MKNVFSWMFVLLLFVNIGCKVKTDQLSDKDLIGTWNGIELKIKGNPVAMPEQEPMLVFADSNRITGFAGCNNFFGTYQVKNDRLQITPGGSTMAFCPDMDFEGLFVKVLSSVSGYKIYDTQLELSNEDGDTILVLSEFQKVGVANDVHGCNVAAGYTWSAVRKECLRLFESGVRLDPVKRDSSAVLSAFLIFSPDSLQVELFLPGTEDHPVLDRRKLPDGTYAWNIEDDDTPNVRNIDGLWTVSKRGDLLYTEPPKPIQVVYVGGDGKSRRLYQVDVTFYPGENKAALQYDGRTYDLPQTISADGFWYKTDSVSLRGKGQQATLTFADGLKLNLSEKDGVQ